MRLDASGMDRAIGVVLGGAVGDALDAGYEFGPVSEAHEITMRPGRLTGEPAGFWTDDTAMAIAILEIAATHGTLIGADAVVAVGERFLDWYRSEPFDIGGQTRAVLEAASSGSD
jgi:ADP-ribosyl-[dinitrogen reductase] hydrolase